MTTGSAARLTLSPHRQIHEHESQVIVKLLPICQPLMDVLYRGKQPAQHSPPVVWLVVSALTSGVVERER